MPYVFYDTETTGIETDFDQILQFAAIRTDDNLTEVDRFSIRCRLLPHVVPSPGALRLTHVTPAMLRDCKEITACTVDRRVVRCARGVGHPAGKACSAGARAHGAIAPGVGGD